MGLSLGKLTRFTWTEVYLTFTENIKITVFKANEDENVHIVHTEATGKKLEIEYNVFGKRTTSPSEACRIYNREEKARKSGRRYAPGSVEEIRSREGRGG